MKTATIDQYHIFGTSSGHGVRLMYRGKTLQALTGHASESARMLASVISRAQGLGFTHWRRFDGAGGVRSMAPEFPRIERGPMIEVPRPIKGRPSYAWVQGWIVRYSPDRVSMPVRLSEARAMLQEAREGKT